jgi:hypothetical protein
MAVIAFERSIPRVIKKINRSMTGMNEYIMAVIAFEWSFPRVIKNAEQIGYWIE